MTAPDQITVELVPVTSLRPDPLHPRLMGTPQLDALARSIGAYGMPAPIIARREDGVIIDGHARCTAAIREGIRSVPVVWVDLTEGKGRLLGLALNRISGSWDEPLLARLVAELDALPELDLTLSGFDGDEIRNLLRSLEVADKRDRPEDFDLEAALAQATRELRTKPGDLWMLDEHRLLFGDATKAVDVERVLGGKRADMAFTDPPYNVDLGNHGGRQRGSRRRTIANDALEPEAWLAFVRALGEHLLAFTDGAIYMCMSSKEWGTVARILAELGGHWSDTIIWAKDRFVLGRADYQRSYEPISYGWREGSTHQWCGDRDQSDVWTIGRPTDAPLHPVMKPLALMERAIANSSRPGDVVLEPFAGSGSTIIACERTGRRCAAIELDPVHVDVAIARWERFTGGTAVRSDG